MEEKKTVKINWLTEYQATELTDNAAFQEISVGSGITSVAKFKVISRQKIFDCMSDLALAISNLYGITPEQEKINIVSHFIYERFVSDRNLYASRNNYEYYLREGFSWQWYRTMGCVHWPHLSNMEESREQFKYVKKATLYAFGKVWNEYMKNPEMRLDDDTLKPLADKHFSPIMAERYLNAIEHRYHADFNDVIENVYEVYDDAKMDIRMGMRFGRKRELSKETLQQLLALTTEFAQKGKREKMPILFGKVVKFFFENDEKVDFESLRQIIKANITQ